MCKVVLSVKGVSHFECPFNDQVVAGLWSDYRLPPLVVPPPPPPDERLLPLLLEKPDDDGDEKLLPELLELLDGLEEKLLLLLELPVEYEDEGADDLYDLDEPVLYVGLFVLLTLPELLLLDDRNVE